MHWRAGGESASISPVRKIVEVPAKTEEEFIAAAKDADAVIAARAIARELAAAAG